MTKGKNKVYILGEGSVAQGDEAEVVSEGESVDLVSSATEAGRASASVDSCIVVRAGPTPFSSRREVFIPEHTTILSRRTSSFQHQQQSPFILSVPHPRTLALNPYLANWLLF
ncbi:unnamed protein product [Prunus armeniaca]